MGRFYQITRIENYWWKDNVKVVGIHGLGGVGKTLLCNRMEQRGFTHHIDSHRFEKSIWFDFRESAGAHLSGFLQQLPGVAHATGFQAFGNVINDNEQFPSPMLKYRIFAQHLKELYKGKLLLILDNLETALDTEGSFHDEELGKWFHELITNTPGKVLVTCRHCFPFFPSGRQNVKNQWMQLHELSYTERICYLNQFTDIQMRSDEDKIEIFKTAGGHPYLLGLVSEYLRRHGSLPLALQAASQNTAVYARLDWFLGQIDQEALDWLAMIVLFPEPKIERFLPYVRMERDEEKSLEPAQRSFEQARPKLVDLSLISCPDAGRLATHPLLRFQLLENEQSKFRLSSDDVDRIRRAIGIVFLKFQHQQEQRQVKARTLLHGVEPVLAQSDVELMSAYLQECADSFLGMVPNAVFRDIVLRAKAALLRAQTKHSLNALGMCAQTLTKMRFFDDASELFIEMLEVDVLTEEQKGQVKGAIGGIYLAQRKFDDAEKAHQDALDTFIQADLEEYFGVVYHRIGMVHEMQRNWDQALKNYALALEWSEKTGRHEVLGSTYHQIGMVHQMQKNWDQALKNYALALEWFEKTGRHEELGGTCHQIGMVHEEQRNWEKALQNYALALEWKEKTGRHEELGGTYHQIGRVHEEQGEYAEAAKYFLDGLDLAMHHDMAEEIPIILRSLKRIWPRIPDGSKDGLRAQLSGKLIKVLEDDEQ